MPSRAQRGQSVLTAERLTFFKSGEKVIIAAFDLSDEPITPRVLLLDKNNAIERDMTPFSVIG